jgi:glycosyltransferase involved in cell wall biosynthesis
MKKDKKLKILLSCLYYGDLTGSELYVYELAKNLKLLDHDVSILSTRIGGPLVEKSKELGIKLFDFNSPPGYVFCSAWGDVEYNGKMFGCKPQTFVKVDKIEFDIIHTQHVPVTNTILKLYPRIPKISTIHSEVINLENPIIHDDIKKYIAIRPEIKDHIIKNFSISKKNVEVVYNPFDFDRFNLLETKDDGYLLFVGTLDYLRKSSIFDLVNYTKENNMEFWLVGKNYSDYLNKLLENDHVKYYDSCSDIEKFVKNCKETAGILLGRTTIEGWLCGKSGWIYDIDDKGNITSKTLNPPPKDIDKFDSKKVTSSIINLYKKII